MSLLNFLGIGSSFNTKLGNNSAFLRVDDDIILIDCGGTVFSKIQSNINILDNINGINIFITHMHTDHVGSLSDLIMYCFFILNKKPNLYFKDYWILRNFLNLTGVDESMYELSGISTHVDIGYYKITPIHVKHAKDYTLLANSYGYLFESETFANFYYSGDSYELPIEISGDLIHGRINRLYQDVSTADFKGNVHMSYKKLKDTIPPELRRKVYCMHLDAQFDSNVAIDDGFNVVELTGCERSGYDI